MKMIRHVLRNTLFTGFGFCLEYGYQGVRPNTIHFLGNRSQVTLQGHNHNLPWGNEGRTTLIELSLKIVVTQTSYGDSSARPQLYKASQPGLK